MPSIEVYKACEEETNRTRYAMSLAFEDMPPSCLLMDGEAGTDEQLRLAGQLGKALLEDNEELRQEIQRLREIVADSHQVGHALSLSGRTDYSCSLYAVLLVSCMHIHDGVQHSFELRSLTYRVMQLCEDLRRSHALELVQVRSSFESESFQLQEELAAVREQLRACERSRRENELRCSKKEEVVVSLEARVRSLEEEVEKVLPSVHCNVNRPRARINTHYSIN